MSGESAVSSAGEARRTAAELAKGALRRLALARQEPTPENYARAWAEEAGTPPPPDPAAQGHALAALIERLANDLDRGGRQWTAARRKDSLQRVLQGSRNDAERLLQRLQSLVQAWEGDRASEFAELIEPEPPAASAPAAAASPVEGGVGWSVVSNTLAGALGRGLTVDDERAADLAARLGALADRLQSEGPDAALVQSIEALCADVQRWFGQRHALVDQLAALCRELTDGLGELAEDDSWAKGQGELVRAQLGQGLSRRALHAAADTLAQARVHQQRARAERTAAREALKELLARMLNEVGELGQQTGVFETAVQQHADAIAGAQSLEGLAGVVQTMLDESRAIGSAVRATRQRLQDQHGHAQALEQRVRDLEAELRRIADEAATDALTQVANRRGLEQAFAAEAARVARAGPSAASGLAIGLIDIDNFKKLNDRLGHKAGDEALKTLAAAVRDRLRPVDHIARFGGEEFVLLLPDTALDEAQQALTRLQRSLSASLFLHEGEEVFVTFSAGVTNWRAGEALETALARADEALYEAKRTGKNRTCKA